MDGCITKAAFLEQIRFAFRDHAIRDKAIAKLNTLRQGRRSFQELFTEFDRLLLDSGKVTGTCTLWAINISKQLSRSPSGLALGDLGHHRAAWPDNGIIIDSSARRAIILEGGKFSNEKGEWELGASSSRPKTRMKRRNSGSLKKRSHQKMPPTVLQKEQLSNTFPH
jgi:hypothetical protein